MTQFKLLAGDILVNVNRRNDPISLIKRWAVGPYEHVFLFLSRVKIIGHDVEIPLLFESMGRGCCLRSLSERYSQEVVVLRLASEYQRKIPRVLMEAVKLASDPQSYYDYYCIIRFVLPRIILEKLHLPIPLAWHRDERQICSEALYEVLYRGGLEGILPPEIVPLPGDFVTDSPLLEMAGAGKLSADWVE